MLGSQPLSAKILSHPRFQKQDHHSTRVQEYLRGQKSGPRVMKPPTKTGTSSHGKHNSQLAPASLPGTGFSSPILQPRTDKNKYDDGKSSIHVKESNTNGIVNKSREMTEKSVGKDDVDDRSKRLKARRVKKEIRRQIMRQNSPEVEEKNIMPNIAKASSYSELSLLRKSPPLNIRSGRLTLKPNIVPGFFSKGKSSTTIRTTNKSKVPVLPAKSNEMSNKKPVNRSVKTSSPSVTQVVRSEDEGSRNGARQATAISDHPPNACQPKSATTNRKTTTNVDSSSSAVSQPSCRYSDVWDIEVEKPLPSDASSIRGVRSRKPEDQGPENQDISSSAPFIQKRHDFQQMYLDSDNILSPMRYEETIDNVVAEKASNANTFFWMPYSSQRMPRASNAMHCQKLEDNFDFHDAQERLLDNLEFISPIRSNSQSHMYTSHLYQDGMNASSALDSLVDSQSGLDERDQCEGYETLSLWPQIGYSDDVEDIIQVPYPYSISCDNTANDYTTDETEGDFEINMRTGSPASSQVLVVDWDLESTVSPNFQTITGTHWDSEEELRRNLQNHWQPQRF